MSASDSSTPPENQHDVKAAPSLPVKNEDAKSTKFFRVACNSSLDQILATYDKEQLAEQYSGVVPLKPKMVDRLHSTLLKVIRDQFKDGIEALIVDDELDKKFKWLEISLQEKGDRKKKSPASLAWRPTGLTPQQQLLAHDVLKKKEVAAQLRKLVATKQERVQQLRAQLVTSRTEVKNLEQCADKLRCSAVAKYQHSNALSEATLDYLSNEAVPSGCHTDA